MKTEIPFNTKHFGIIPGIDDFSCPERLSSSYYMWRVSDSDESGTNRHGIVRKTQGEYQLVIPCIYSEICPVDFSNSAQEPILFLVRRVDTPKNSFRLFDIEKARILTFEVAGNSSLKIENIRNCAHVNGPANAPIFLLNQQFLFDQTGAEVVIPLPGCVLTIEEITAFKDGEEVRVLAVCNRGTEKPVACVTDVLLGRLGIVLPFNL